VAQDILEGKEMIKKVRAIIKLYYDINLGC
jgi:hypothetical protein